MTEVFVASTYKRFFALFIDQILMLVCYMPFATKFYEIYTTDNDVIIPLWQLFVLFLIPMVYEAVSLFLMGATPGKYLLGLKVVPFYNPDHELEIGQCILRPMVSRLSVFFSWAIFALAFFRYDRTHLSDWVAETRVVQFHPRRSRAHIRWILGTFLVAMYSVEGLSNAMGAINQIDWKKGQVELRGLMTLDSMDSVQFDMGGDDDDGE